MIVDAKAHKRYGEPARVEINVMVKEELEVSKNAENIFNMMNPCEMDTFLTRAGVLGKRKMEYFYSLEGKTREKWIEETAVMLSSFAERYADKLKKICKFNMENNDANENQHC